MASYKTGSVTIDNGSSKVVGNNTEFNTYVSTGNLFKLNQDSAFYEVAAVQSATRLILSSRYYNSDYQTARTNEHIATTNVGTTIYSGTLAHTPVIQNYVTINASYEVYHDDGAGNLTGTPTGSGTVDYDTGSWSINMAATHNASINVTASYYSGDTLSNMSYQIVTDYTPNYSFPEMSVSDLNFQHIFTKSIRMVDEKLYNANVNAITASQDIEVLASNYGLILKSPDGNRWRITVSNTGTLLTATI